MNPSQATDSESAFVTVSTTPIKGTYNGGLSYEDVSPGNFRFALEGSAVPEPSSALLLLSGSLLLWRHRSLRTNERNG
jgi:hypothetical protein